MYWTGDDIEDALSSELFLTMQVSRALAALRARRRAAEVYYPLPQPTNWRHEDINFLCTLLSGRYHVERRDGGGRVLWQVDEAEVARPHRGEPIGTGQPRVRLLPPHERGQRRKTDPIRKSPRRCA